MYLVLIILVVVVAILLILYWSCMCKARKTDSQPIPIDWTTTLIAQPYLSNLEEATAYTFISLQLRGLSAPLVIVYPNRIDVYVNGGLQDRLNFMSASNLYSYLYDKGMRYLIGFVTSVGLQDAITWVLDNSYSNSVSLISLGAAASSFEYNGQSIPPDQLRFAIRLNSSYEYWLYPNSAYRDWLQAPLIIYNNDATNRNLANLIDSVKPYSLLLQAENDIAAQVSENIGTRTQVVLLTFDLAAIRTSAFPSVNDNDEAIEYFTSDTLVDLDLSGFTHTLRGYNPYVAFPSELTSITWSRIIYSAYIPEAIRLATDLIQRQISASQMTGDLQETYGLLPTNARQPKRFVEWTWTPGPSGGVWSYGFKSSKNAAVQWATQLSGSITQGVQISMGSAGARLCYLYRQTYWTRGDFDQLVTRGSLESLDLPPNSSELISQTLQTSDLQQTFSPDLAPNYFVQQAIGE